MISQIKIVVGFILSIILISCAPLNVRPPDLTIDNIKITFNELQENISGSTSMKGEVWNDRMYLEVVPDKQTNDSHDKIAIILMRNTSFDHYREIASDKIAELKKE